MVDISIYVATYNHEKYIERALDSILMQKTKYSFEILVGEDCSTDNTRQVLQAWEKRHPGAAQIFYREKNMHNDECTNALDLKRRCTGKYIIALEGDDFWTDPEKLEMQATFLETHPEYYAVAHNCEVVGKDSLPNGEAYPECKDEEYTLRHFASDILPGQLTTILARNYMLDENFDLSFQDNPALRKSPGDRRLYFAMASQGRIHCIQRKMSAYRHITSEGSSFSATHRYSYAREEMCLNAMMVFARKLNHAMAIKCAEMLYMRNIRYAIKTKQIRFKQAYKDWLHIQRKYRAIWLLIRRDIRLHLLRKELHL